MNLVPSFWMAACALALLGAVAPQASANTCQLNLSEPLLDFGLMNRAARNPSAPQWLLGERRISVQLNCPQAQDMTLFYRAPAASAERLRFTERGSYALRVQEAVLDGQAVELGLLAGSGQAPGHVAQALAWRPNHAITPLRDGVPAQGKSLALVVQVSAWAQADATQLREAVTWETSGLLDSVATGRSQPLTLQARFAPAACEPSLSGGGVVDLGKLSASDLRPDEHTRLPAKSLLLSIRCDAPTSFALVMHDNREGTATGGADETAYGLGLDNSRQKIGRYYLNINPADIRADALPQVYRTDSTTAGTAWSGASNQPIPIGARSYLGFTATPGSHAGPAAIQNLSGNISIQAWIAPTQALDLSNEVALDGSGTIEIIYL